MTKAIVDALKIIEVKVEYSKSLVQTIESSKGALKSLLRNPNRSPLNLATKSTSLTQFVSRRPT